MSLPETPFTQATRIRLLPGSYREAYLEARHGTSQFPILIEPADGPNTVTFEPKGLEGGSLQFIDVSYVYLQEFRVRVEGGDGLHLERCDHVLFRRLRISSVRSEGQDETVKINQSKYIYIEDCDIFDAGDNCIDMVAVQWGHIVRNKLHNAQDWVIYLKGGSAYFTIEGNEIYGGGTGGLTCGQGTGFQFMSSPWIHYEAYDIKVINNIIHDCEGAGLGVNSGYNILMAHNTLYRVGSRSHLAEFVHGSRGCDGNEINACLPQLKLGGWGTTNEGGQFIPNRQVCLFNNVLYDPTGFTTGGQFLAVAAPIAPPVGSNLPNPSRADDGLVFRGNIFWATPFDLPLGIEDPTQGCQEGTCTEAQLRAENHFNDLEPDFISAAEGDFRPQLGGRLASQVGVAMPDFTWDAAPSPPLVPPGNLDNRVARDRSGAKRPTRSPPGALLP
ncbi:MAG: right-handed parallel beta-helix repeat-containing protein [Pedosphaera sp.]|nr:right-handed parallel beta-helix repeat-containing protein [Pedosphaera sp.]